MSSQSPKDRSTTLSASEPSPTIRVSSSLDLASSPLVVSPSRTSSPKACSPATSPLKSQRDAISTACDQAPPSPPPIYSALSLPGNLGDSGGSSFRSRTRSPLGQIDDTITQWRNTLLGWWNEHKGKNVELQETMPEWQQTKMCVIRAASLVLGNTVDVTHEALNAGVDLHEFAPLPGLALAARTLLEIWDGLSMVNINRTACLRLTKRCANILISVREEIRDAGDIIKGDLASPLSKLIDSFSLVRDLIHKANHRPFIKRYLKRDEFLRQISECDQSLVDVLGMFSLSIQVRILRQVQASELQRQQDTREAIVHASPPSNALLLTGVENTPSILHVDSVELQLPPASSRLSDEESQQAAPDAQQPLLVVNDIHEETSPHLLPTLQQTTNAHEVKLDIVHKLLDFPAYGIVLSELKDPLDIEQLLDLILHLLHDNSLSDSAVQDANRKLRKLMFKLISMTDVLPRSLFITDVTTLDVIGVGGFGRVFKGKHKGQHVALKVVDKTHKSRSLREDFCREALTWRSLQHCFIIPLLGIYEEKSLLHLVSPFMINGTISHWRKNYSPIVSEIHRLIREAAEGMHYLHSEGIVHGDLHGGNILLDSELHCQITDFGLTRHFEATATQSTVAVAYHFAAPELFGLCLSCNQPRCYGCGATSRRKTMQTDVYAFGCLYYAIFFDSVPFETANNFLIMRFITDGIRPDRLESPAIDDQTWNLISTCWKANPSERPTMEQIMNSLSV